LKIFVETSRLILREILPSDDEAIFRLDSDPRVHRYLGNNPIKTMQEAQKAIEFIRQQYLENGIGRWAVIEKSTQDFMGWSGLKLMKETRNNITNYYDLGYRLMPQYWEKGYATESAIAARDYGFDTMKLDIINGTAECTNTASRHVLEKAGLKRTGSFLYYGEMNDWFEITRESWEKQRSRQ
jgi:ribosomal-protein-alanine N-acetyltransferase